jgi:protein O-mannosyl-transferase
MTSDNDAAVQTAALDPAPPGSRMHGTGKLTSYLLPGLVALITFVAFSPALRNGFVNWDDLETLVENQNFRGFSWPHLSWMFTTFHQGHYQPLSWLTFSLDYLLWGMEPFGYHLTNILFHSANAVLFYFVTLRLLVIASPIPGAVVLKLAAGFSAFVFALHPLRVESVAWATERRDVLSGFFLLLTVLSYLKAVGPETNQRSWRRWIALSVILYVLSLLSKASGMTFPLVLLALDVYPLRRLRGGIGQWFSAGARRVWLEKLPFLIAAAAAAAVALMAQQKAGALMSTETHDLTGRVAQGLYGITFYMVKTLQPTDLAPLYEIPAELGLFHWRVIFAAIIFILFSLGSFAVRHRWPAGMAGWIVYLLLLAPVLGVAQAGLQLVADRYSYLSCMVWAILLATVLCRLWRPWTAGAARPVIATLLIAIPLAALFGLATLTWRQIGIWHDSERLWNHALAVSPSSMAHFHVGRFAAQRGDLAEAEKHLRRAVEINPQNDVIQSNLALALARKGNLVEATAHFHRALEINPADPATLNNMGITLAQQGKLDEAIQHFQRSLEIKPNDASGHTNLANVLLSQGDADRAVKHLRRAIEIDPADNQSSFAMVLAKRGDLAGAAKHLRRVVELKPGDAAAANNLAITLAQQGQLGEAAQHFETALGIDPNLAEAHAGLARVLAMQKKPEEAMRHYQEALRILKAQQKTAASRDGK